jgi:hypothetical protein
MSGWGVLLDIPIQIGRDEARRRALEELAKAKYGGTPDWVQRASDRFSRVIEHLFELYLRYLSSRGAGGGVNPGFVIAVLVLLAIIALVVWRVGLPRWRSRRRDESLALDPTVPAADYRELAQRQAEAGLWAAAVRDRFRAVVRELEVRTILDVRPARTAWEAAYSASRALPQCAESLRTGAEMFNAVVYGDRVADAAAYAQLVAVDEAVTAAADAVDLAADLAANPEPVAR